MEHFPWLSAHRKTIFWACEITTHILTLSCHVNHSWIEHLICDPEPFCSKQWTTVPWTENYVINLLWYKLGQTSESLGKIVLFNGKVGANFQIFRCPRSFHTQWQINNNVLISGTSFLQKVNWPTHCDFIAP